MHIVITGKFQLLIKVYKAWGDKNYAHSYRPAGAVSNFINELKIGETALFKHISFNVKVPYPFREIKTITMLAVGAGIAPMIQALYKLLETEGEKTEVVLLYGNRSVKDVLLRDQLSTWSEKFIRFRFIPVIGSRWFTNVRMNLEEPKLPEGFEELAHPRCVELAKQLQMKTALCTSQAEREELQAAHLAEYSHEFATLKPAAELGWINWHTIKKYAFPPSQETRVFVCGLPDVYVNLCGPRNEKEIAPDSALAKLGYTSEMVVKF